MKLTFTFNKNLPFKNQITKKFIFKINRYICTIYEHNLSRLNITNVKYFSDIETLKTFFKKEIHIGVKSINIDNIFIFVPFPSNYKFNFYQVYYELKFNLSEKFFIFLNEESFHGITLKPLIRKSAPTFLVYRSGKIIIMGKFDLEEILKMIKYIHQVIKNKEVKNGVSPRKEKN